MGYVSEASEKDILDNESIKLSYVPGLKVGKTGLEKRLDEKITAVCACEKEQKILTYRTLKNKWPHCSCKMSMKVLTNAT